MGFGGPALNAQLLQHKDKLEESAERSEDGPSLHVSLTLVLIFTVTLAFQSTSVILTWLTPMFAAR